MIISAFSQSGRRIAVESLVDYLKKSFTVGPKPGMVRTAEMAFFRCKVLAKNPWAFCDQIDILYEPAELPAALE